LEERRVLSGSSAAWLDAARELVITAGSQANDGHADTFSLVRQGDQLHASVNGEEVYAGSLGDIAKIRVEGSTDPDTLSVDFSGGSPLPAGGIKFDGGGSPQGPADSLVLARGSFGGTIDTVTYDFQGIGAGMIHIALGIGGPGTSTFDVVYSGVGSIRDATRADHLVFHSAPGGETLTLGDDGQARDGVSAVSSGGLKVAFDEPTESLTVDAGPGGTLIVSGTIDASNAAAGETGGTVRLFGGHVDLVDGARIDVSGDAGGGTVLIGGGLPGRDAPTSALTTFVGPDVVIRADALRSGDGGTVIVWADQATDFAGAISARGGPSGGSGGFAEVSGRESFAFRGLADLSAPSGAAGRLLLDPATVDIDAPFAATIVRELNFADVVIQADDAINVLAPVDAADAAGNHSLILAAPAIHFDDGANLVTHDGDLVLQGDVVLVGGATVLLSTGLEAGGDVDIEGAVDGTGGLESLSLLAGTGTVTVNGAVGSGIALAVSVLDCDAATFTGPVNSTTISLAGIHDTIGFDDDVTATALDTTVDGYHIEFRGASNTITEGATFLNTGGVTLGGGDTALTAAGGTLAFYGPVTLVGGATLANSGGDIHFYGPVTLAGDAAIEAADSITFESPLVSSPGRAYNLTLASDADIYFNDSVGAGSGNALGAITITGAVNVTAGSTIHCASLVQWAGFGTTTLRGDVTTTAAGGLDITADRIALDGLSITALGGGEVRFGGPVDLVGDVAIDAAGSITFDSTLGSSEGTVHNLTLAAGADIRFNDAVGWGAANELGVMTIAGARDVTASSTIDCAGLVQLAGSGTTFLEGDVTTSSPEGVDLTARRIVLDSLTMTTLPPPPVPGSTAAGGDVRFAGPVDLAGDVAIDAAGSITFGQTVVSSGGGAHALTLTSAADILFDDAAGAGPGNALGAITITWAVDVTASSTIESASLVQLDGSSTGTTRLEGDVRTSAPEGVDITASQIVLDDVTITTLDGGIVRFNGRVDLAGDVTIDAAGSITFERTVASPGDTAQALTLASDADIEFLDAVGAGAGNALGAITIDRAVNVEAFDTIDAASLVQLEGSGTTTLHGDVTTTFLDGVDITADRIVLDNLTIATSGNGIVRFGGPVDLIGDVTIDAADTITFEETVTSPDDTGHSLTLGSDVHIYFDDTVGAGSGNALGAITITRAYDVEFWDSIDAASLVQSDGFGTTTLHGDVTTSVAEGVGLTTANVVLDGLAITTIGDGIVHFGAPVDLTGDVTIDAAGAITFEQTVVSSEGRAGALTLASQDNIEFSDSVGWIEGNQLGLITIVTAVDVTVRSTVEAAGFVQRAGSGTTTLAGSDTETIDDGAIVSYHAVTTTASDGVNIAASQVVLGAAAPDPQTITATGGGIVRFNGPVDLTGDVTITAEGAITFENTLVSSNYGAHSLTLASDADIRFNDAVGAGPASALGAIMIATAVDVTACSTIDAASLVEQAGLGTTTLYGDVTTTAAEGVDLTAGQIVLDGLGPDGLNIANPFGGLVRLNGPVELDSDVTIDTLDGNILFTAAATIDSGGLEYNNLTLTAGAGSVSFNADVGDTQPIGNLIVRQADAGVAFGNDPDALDPDLGPVAAVNAYGQIDLGSEAVLGGITLNAGDGNTIFFTSTDRARLNGPVTLNSDASIDTSAEGTAPGSEIRFTLYATIDSQAGENNDLILNAGGEGDVSFNADIGVSGALGQLIVIEAKGVAFGNDAGPDPDLGLVTVVRVDGDLDPSNADVFDIDLGSVRPVGDDGIRLNAGDGSTISFSTTADAIRFNGSVELDSHALIDTTGADFFSPGAEIRFTVNATIDSQAGEDNDLILTAGTDGIVSFNADIGTQGELGELIVTHAAGVALGNDPNDADLDLGPVTTVRVDGDPADPGAFAINLGSVNPIGEAGIALDGGDGNMISLITTADPVRFNGAVMIMSDTLIDTTDSKNEVGAEIRFTLNATIDGQNGENNDLILTAGTDGTVNFNANIGAETPLGQLIVTDAAGVTFEGDPSLPMTTVRVDGDLDPMNPDAFDIDIGSVTPIGAGGITVGSGDGSTISFVTSNDAVRFSGSLTLLSNAEIVTYVASDIDTSGADILIDGSIDGAGTDLSLISHAGTTTVTGAVGGGGPLGTLSLQDVQPESTGPVLFLDAVYATSLVTSSQPYDVELLGGGEITDFTQFDNTGGVTLGDSADDYLTFDGGVTSTASTTSIGGTVETFDLDIQLGTVFVIADSRLMTAGGNITFFGTVDGELEEANNLELTAWTGTVEFQANVGADVALGELVVQSAGEVIVGADAFPVSVFKADGGIDLGRDSAIDGMIQLNGGPGGLLAMSTAGGMVRFNGVVELQSDVLIDTSDDGVPEGAEIRFTANSPVDSRAGEYHDLILRAGTDGTVDFNADIGASQPLGQLIVMEANGVVLGNDPSGDDPDLNPVWIVQVGDPVSPLAFAVNIGSDMPIGADGIVFNGGDGNTISLATPGGGIRLNGAVELASDVFIDTTADGQPGAEIRFTLWAPIDSQFEESNGLTLTAGTDGVVSFNSDIGATQALGHLIVTDAKSVVFGGEGTEEPPDIDPDTPPRTIDFAPLTTVRVAGDPWDPAAYVIDIGSNTLIGTGGPVSEADGIVLNGGTDGSGNPLNLDIATTNGAVRLNGAVGLWSNVLIDTTDGGAWSGAEIRFTANATIDSQAGEWSDLTLAAGTDGVVDFNGNIGANEALGQLIVTSARGVAIGNDSDGGDLAPVSTVQVQGDPLNPVPFAIDIGKDAAIGADRVRLNAGDGSTILLTTMVSTIGSLTTPGGRIRFNGAVELDSNAQIVTAANTDPGPEIRFTVNAPIDSQVDENNFLVLSAGPDGTVDFNADIGANQALAQLTVTDSGKVAFGNDPSDSDPDLNPVSVVQIAGDPSDPASVTIGAGRIEFNSGNGQELSVVVESGDVSLDGPVWLNSSLSIDTSQGDGNMAFSENTTIDSQFDDLNNIAEYNNLRLNAGLGSVSFGADIGVAGPEDTPIGFLRVESSGTIDVTCDQVKATGEIVLESSGNVTISGTAPGLSTITGYSVTIDAGLDLMLYNDVALRSETGQVSNAPPIFRPTPDDPNKVLVPGDRVQTITGTIGGDGTPGDNLERAENLTLTIYWSDGMMTVFPVGINAGDTVSIFVNEDGTVGPWSRTPPELGHENDPIHFTLSREYSLAYLETVSTTVETWMVVSNDPKIRLDDSRPESLNESSAVSAIKVASELFRFGQEPPLFIPPPLLRPVEAAAIAPEIRPVPQERLIRYEEAPPTAGETAEEARLIYLVRVFPGGREGDPYLLPDDALADLARLFEQFRAEGLPNGRYRIYLKEVGLPPRQVIEFYKSGDTFGETTRERGPGSNPLSPGQSAPSPSQGEKPTSQAEALHGQTAAVRHPGPLVTSPPSQEDSGPGDSAGPQTLPSSDPAAGSEAIDGQRDGSSDRAAAKRAGLAALGDSPGCLVRPLVGALAVSLGAVAEAAALEEWAKRVDDALENSPEHGLSRRRQLQRRFGD
jgi:hypothetical protein